MSVLLTSSTSVSAYSTIVSKSVSISCSEQQNVLHLTRSVRDIENDSTRSYYSTYLVQNEITPITKPIEIQKYVFDLSSKSMKYTIRAFNLEEKCILEVYENGSLLYKIDSTDIHRKANGDAWFGSPSFSADESMFSYVAVPKDAKATTYFDKPTVSAKSATAAAITLPSSSSTKYDYKEDWGEKYTGTMSLDIFVLRITDGTIKPISCTDGTIGQPVFTPNDRGVVYMHWSHLPRRLGMTYCFQRPCQLQYVKLSDVFNDEISTPQTVPKYPITSQFTIARSPRFLVDGDNISLIFLGRKDVMSTHNGPCEVYKLDWSTFPFQEEQKGQKETQENNKSDKNNDKSDKSDSITGDGSGTNEHSMTVVDTLISLPFSSLRIKQTFASENNRFSAEKFPGIFCDKLHRHCFLSRNILLLEATWRCASMLLLLNITTKQLTPLAYNGVTCVLHTTFSFLRTPINGANDNDIHTNQSNEDEFSSSKKETKGGDKEDISHEGKKEEVALSLCPWSITLLDISSTTDNIVLQASDPTTPPKLIVIQKSDLLQLLVNRENEMSTGECIVPTIVSPVLPTIAVSTLPIQHQSAVSQATSNFICSQAASCSSKLMQIRLDSNNIGECILILPFPSPSPSLASSSTPAVHSNESSDTSTPPPPQRPPMIVIPHGGPHSSFTTAYLAPYEYLSATCKVALLLVNYRGSIGYGNDNLNSLPGNIGTNDVSDVYACTMAIVNATPPLVDSTRLGICGGSHGGYLTAHMIGQYPTLYKLAMLRNPVIDIPSMYYTSDIPDWCIVEACGLNAYDFNTYKSATAEQLMTMYDVSPIKHVSKVHQNMNVLILLGVKDRRVPYHQGLQFYHLLTSKGINAIMKLYPQCDHAIDNPNAEADQYISMMQWIQQYI